MTMAFELYELQPGQTVIIEGIFYTVSSVVEFRQDDRLWKEYQLAGSLVQNCRLVVNGLEEIPHCVFMRTLDFCFSSSDSPFFHGDDYQKIDSGTATVISTIGRTDIAQGDAIQIDEYQSNDEKRLNRKMWSGKVICSAGERLSKSEISTISTNGSCVKVTNKSEITGKNDGEVRVTSDSDIKINIKIKGTSGDIFSTAPPGHYEALTQLEIGREVLIEGVTYQVVGHVICEHDQAQWKEYDLLSSNWEQRWLSIELGEVRDRALSLHRTINYSSVTITKEDNSAQYIKKTYKLVESGGARVISYKGRGDYDEGEGFFFAEYRSGEGKILTCEYWKDDEGREEEEASIGKDLDISEIKILGIRKTISSIYQRHHESICSTLISVVLIVLLVYLETDFDDIPEVFKKEIPIEQQIASHALFTPVTSITLEKDVKAQVYSTFLSMEDVCQIIIKMDPENIQYVTQTSDDPEKGERLIQTAKETVMIYAAESEDTYAQVNPNIKNSDSYTTYRSHNSTRARSLYLGSWRWFHNKQSPSDARSIHNINTNRYEADVASARQASIRARKSSGGGSGFGK